MSETNRSYSLIETPEQEAIARLLLADYINDFSIIVCKSFPFGEKFRSYGLVKPSALEAKGYKLVPFPDLILQGLGADGVQAVRALAGIIGCLGEPRYTPSTHPFFEYDQDD